MNPQKIFAVIFVLISACSICLGQNEPDYVEGETWVAQYGIYPVAPMMVFRYDRYSREDTVRFREKLDALKDAKLTDEWEGNYGRDNEELNFSGFNWTANAGFVDFNIYTCMPELRNMNYGKILNTAEFVQTIPEFALDSPRKAQPVKFVKVRWGARYYLVEESSLLTFAEKAVGIYVRPDEDADENQSDWTNYWIKSGAEQEITGLPEFPASYKKFKRQPIETKIVSVGKRMTDKERESGNKIINEFFPDAAVYPVVISAGKNKNVKPGMRFEITETGEEIYITEVKQNTALGFVARDTNESNNETCRDQNYQDVPCLKLKSDLKIKTPIGKIWFF